MAPLSPRLRAILDDLPLSAEMRVLEVGCGPGALALAIADHHARITLNRGSRRTNQ